MSTLTKVFIVLLAVFSIAFTMMAISFVVQTNDWKKLADDYRANAQVVESSMRNLAASHAAEKATWLDVRAALDRKTAGLEADSQQKAQDLAKRDAELTAMTLEKRSADDLANRLSSQLQIAETGWKTESERANALEQRKLDLEKRNQDLDDRVSEQATQIIAMEQEKRQLEQQVYILRNENKRLAQAAKEPPTLLAEVPAGVSKGRVLPLTETAGTPIRGRLLDVEGRRASISVGSSDGVEAGMVFVIYRGGDFIGDLEVTDVEPDKSAGRITLTRGTPRTGDLVMDESRMGVVD